MHHPPITNIHDGEPFIASNVLGCTTTPGGRMWGGGSNRAHLARSGLPSAPGNACCGWWLGLRRPPCAEMDPRPLHCARQGRVRVSTVPGPHWVHIQVLSISCTPLGGSKHPRVRERPPGFDLGQVGGSVRPKGHRLPPQQWQCRNGPSSAKKKITIPK